MPEPRAAITQMLREFSAPDRGDAAELRERLYRAIYPELKRAAAALMRAEAGGHILQPTALVHEAFLKMVDTDGSDWRNRAHFLGVATRAMRQVLVDHARRRKAAKRGGALDRVTLDEAIAEAPRTLGILELDDVLGRLKALHPRMAQVVEFRVFGGLSHEEIAEVLGVSVRTSVDDWSFARRWLVRELSGAGG